jgi:hypothetical protein
VTERPRRRSRDVTLWAVPLLAAAFVACGGNDDSAYCVDQNDQIVENEKCDDDAINGSGAFFWYYGGRAAGGTLVRGAKLSGGDRVAASNIAENARRGGFGSSGRSNSSGVGRSVATHSRTGGG